MTDYRAGRWDHPTSGWRSGTAVHSTLTTDWDSERAVASVSGVAGTAAFEVALAGAWDAAGKTAVLIEPDGVTEVALTITAQAAGYIRFTVPTPWADGSAFNMFNANFPYTLRVTDGTGDVDGELSILHPSTSSWWYVGAATGSPWDQTSAYYLATGLSDGDSSIAEVLAGTMVDFSPNGQFVVSESTRFRIKGYSVDGWSTSWATINIVNSNEPVPVCASASLAANGETLTLVFGGPVIVTGTPQLTIAATNGATTADYTSGGSSNTLVFTVARVIGGNEIVTASFTSGASMKSIEGTNVASFSINVTNGATDSLVGFYGSVPDMAATVGKVFNANLSAFFTGVVGAGYSIQSGALPNGLTLGANSGAISGTPVSEETQAGIVVRGTDGSGTADTNQFTISVRPARTQMSGFNSPDRGFQVGELE